MSSSRVPITSPVHLGEVLRATRKIQRLRQDEVGSLSHSFIGEVESGKPTAQIGKVFDLLRELGMRLYVELPPGIPSTSKHPRPRTKSLP